MIVNGRHDSLINLIQTVFVLVVILSYCILIKRLQCPWLWFQYQFFSITVASRKKVKTLKEKRIKEKNMKIKEDSQQRNHLKHPNVEQVLLQQRKRTSQLEGQFYPEELPVNHSSSAWLLLLRLGKRFCWLKSKKRLSHKCLIIFRYNLVSSQRDCSQDGSLN